MQDFCDKLEQALNPEPPRIIRRVVQVPTTIDVCPHCNEEIAEKSLRSGPNNTWRHSCCDLPMRSSEEAEQEAADFARQFGISI